MKLKIAEPSTPKVVFKNLPDMSVVFATKTASNETFIVLKAYGEVLFFSPGNNRIVTHTTNMNYVDEEYTNIKVIPAGSVLELTV